MYIYLYTYIYRYIYMCVCRYIDIYACICICICVVYVCVLHIDHAYILTRAHISPQECKASVTRCLHLVSLGWPRAAPPRHTLKKLLKFFSEGYLK